jgi:hypothetical protein
MAMYHILSRQLKFILLILKYPKMKLALAALLAGSAAAFAPAQSGKSTTALQVSELGKLTKTRSSGLPGSEDSGDDTRGVNIIAW